jgi:hypothetical protein
VGVLLASGVVHAQPAGPRPSNNPRLDLGLVVAAHGADIEITLTLRLPTEVAVGRAEAEIRFPKRQMSYTGARPAPKGLKVDVQRQPDKGEDSVLKVVAEGAERPIPAGPLTTIVFRVAKDATETVKIELPLEARLWGYPDTSREITPVETRAGRVTIQDLETFYACFFYMH